MMLEYTDEESQKWVKCNCHALNEWAKPQVLVPEYSEGRRVYTCNRCNRSYVIEYEVKTELGNIVSEA